MSALARCVAVGLLAVFSTGCDCWFFKHGNDESSQSDPGGPGGGSGGGSGGGGGTGGGGDPTTHTSVPEIDPSALRGGLAVLVCGTLILVDRRYRGRAPAKLAV
jgi:hypothetical protein